MKQSAEPTYGLEDRPPASVIISTALQQATVILVWIFPALVLARELGMSQGDAAALVSLSFIGCGIGTMVQASRRGGFGCGFLAPVNLSTAHLLPSLLAAKLGGLPLLAGMTICSGLASIAVSRLLHRLRALIPPEVAGAVVLIIGIGVSIIGLRMLLERPSAAAPGGAELLVALLTLAIAGGLGVWGRGPLRWACLLIAMIAGSLAAVPLGLFAFSAEFQALSLPLFALPRLVHTGFDFDLALLPAFVVAAVASGLKTAGAVTTLQQVNDPRWARPEPHSIAGGVAGDGIATMVAGALATPGLNIGAANAAIQLATGVSSRIVAPATAALCLLLACLPAAGAVAAELPAPVIAAALIYSGALMTANGIQLAAARLLDARRGLAVGLAMTAALAMELVPRIAEWVPSGLRPMMTATAFGTLVALLLNLVLRIGIRRSVTLSSAPGALSSREVDAFVTRAGAAWGARRDVMARASHLAANALDAVAMAGVARGEVLLELGFDEARIDLRIAYAGAPLILADRPPGAAELLDDESAPARLAGHLVRRLSEGLRQRSRGGTTELLLSLDH